MDNTDKKQPMSDEELAKISGGYGTPDNCACPFCGREFGLRIAGHMIKCPMNPSNQYNKG